MGGPARRTAARARTGKKGNSTSQMNQWREKLVSHLQRKAAEERILEQPTEETYFKALKHGKHKSYQGADKSQFPPPLFPATLASFVLVFATDDEWFQHGEKDDGGQMQTSFCKQEMMPLLDKLRSADMIVREEEFGVGEGSPAFVLISISEKRQKQVAELMGAENLMRLRLRAEDDEDTEVKGGGAWYPFKQHLAHLYEKSSEGTLFSSCQQCQIMEYMLNERNEKAMGPQLVQKEACEPGHSPLQQLVKDEKILGYFYLHHPHKKEWLEKNWVDSWTHKQPLEDIREYFGEEVGLYFVWLGYMLTSLWVPAIVGVMMFVIQLIAEGESGSIDNPFNPLYALFIALWSIMLNAGWERLENTMQYIWGTVDFEEEEVDRTEFVQNKRTYKRLNYISQTEEYYPDPLWRLIAVMAGFLATCLMLALNIFVIVMVEAGKSSLQEWLGLGHAGGLITTFVSSNVQAALILLLRWGADFAFLFLTDFENWKTPQQYENAIIAKRFCFGFINSYFAIYFIAFMANHVTVFGVDMSCHERKCINPLALMVAVIFLQNVLCRYFMSNLLPMYQQWQIDKKAGEAATEEGGEDIPIPDEQRAIQTQHQLPPFTKLRTVDDYSNKMIELGYVQLFGAAFPLLALLALIYNIVDLRTNARMALNGTQRPMYKCAKDIGTWKTIMDIFCTMSIMSQCAYLGFTSRALYYYFPNMTTLDNVFYAVAAEHVLLLIKVFMSDQDAPDSIIEANEKREHECALVMEEYDTFDPTEEVVFYTSDDGQVDIRGPEPGVKDKEK